MKWVWYSERLQFTYMLPDRLRVIQAQLYTEIVSVVFIGGDRTEPYCLIVWKEWKFL